MQAVVSSLLTTYQRVGNGKQLLILHGWGDSSTGWQSFAAALGKDFEVITVDLPGFGSTQAPPHTWGLNDYADFVAAFIKKVGISPVSIIGHSNGGGIAIRGLANGTLQTDFLVLLSSAGIRGENRNRNTLLRFAAKAGKALSSPLPKSSQQKLRRNIYTMAGSDMLVAEHLQDTFKKVVTDDVQADAAKLSTPTLLIYGEADTQTPVRHGQLFHELIAGSQLEIIPKADHFAHLSNAAKIVALIRDLVR